MALEFKIELSGNFAGAQEKNAAATDKAGEATKKHKHELELFESELGKAKAELGGFGINLDALSKGGSLFTFDLAEGFRSAVEVAHELAETVVDLGKEMIKAAADAEDLNLAIKLDVGQEGLEKVDKLAESFRDSRFSPKLIKEALLPILEESGDEHSDQWEDLVTAATDVATRRKTGAGGAKSALEALRGIEIQPQKIRGALKELGIKQKDFYDDLGGLLGISKDSAEKQVKAGQVKAQTLLSVALHQIAEREGGSLGNATNEGSKTLGASLDRLANLKDNLFEKLADSPGMHAVQGFLDNFIQTMEGPIGTDLVAKVGGAFEALFGDLSGPDGLKKMEAVVGSIADKVGDFLDGFKEAWPEIKADFEAAIPVIEKVAGVMGDIVKFLGALPRVGDAAGDAVGQSVVDDLTGTVGHADLGNGRKVSLDEQDREAALKRSGKNGFFHELFSSDDTLTNEALSQVLKENQTGGSSGSWDDIPKLAAGGYVDGPTVATIGEAGPEAVVPLSRRSAFTDFLGEQLAQRGGGGDITYAPVYHVSGGDSSAVREQLEQLDRQSRIEFAKIIEELRAA